MKHRLLIVILLLSSVISLTHAQTSTITYPASDENFPNPERGLYHYTELRSPNSGLTAEELTQFREEESITLIYRIFYLEDFRDRPISAEYLATVRQDFATMREAGIKCVLRFAYTDKFVNGFDNPPYNDAPPLDLLLEHVDQLAPVIRANVDVIAVMQAGFIGTWGEWYYSDLYTTSGNLEQPSESDWDNRRSLIDKLLQVVPPSRMIQVRYPVAKFALTGSEEPLTAEEAYQNTPRARIAHHNDCFVSSTTDVGTYKDLEPEKAFLEQDSRYLAVGGETCALSPPTSDCPNAEAELGRFHWSYLNIDYNTDVLDGWREQGCWEPIVKKLGYRLRLTEATVQNQAKANGGFSLQLSLVNDGYASPFNPRLVNVVLRKTDNGGTSVLPTNEDPRRWVPGEPITINVEAGIPASMADGDYEVLLHLADPEPAVTNRSDYAIRLANEGVWETETGYNALNHTLRITSDAPDRPYPGDQYFTPLTPQLLNGPTRIRVDGQADDWNNVYPAATAEAATLRVFNSADSLYLLVEGSNAGGAYRFLLDTDNVGSTGYQAAGWLASGMDYLVENGQLRAYAGDGDTDQWEDVAPVRMTADGTVVEVGIAFADLGGAPDFFRVGYASGEVIVPATTQPLPPVGLMPDAMATRLALSATTTATQVIVYWGADFVGDEKEVVLERSTDQGSTYEELAVLDTGAITYTDRDPGRDTPVTYRLYARNAPRFSYYTNPTTVTISPNGDTTLTEITVDNALADWAGVAPLATALSPTLQALRVFNDRDSLYFSVEGNDQSSFFWLYLDVDHDATTGYSPETGTAGGAEVKVEGTNWYRYTDEAWQLMGTTTVTNSRSVTEGALALSDLLPEDNRRIRLAWVNAPEGDNRYVLPAAGRPWPTYRLALASAVPTDFEAQLSSREPTSRILLRWTDADDEQGYVIERSEGDSLGFAKIADVPANATQFLDVDLPSGTSFFYRIRSFNAVGTSGYSPVVRATTEGDPITGLNEDTLSTSALTVYPNPAQSNTTIRLRLRTPQTITLTAYDVLGAAQRTIAHGTYSTGTHYFSLTPLVKGSTHRLLFIRLEGTDNTGGHLLQTVRLLTP